MALEIYASYYELFEKFIRCVELPGVGDARAQEAMRRAGLGRCHEPVTGMIGSKTQSFVGVQAAGERLLQAGKSKFTADWDWRLCAFISVRNGRDHCAELCRCHECAGRRAQKLKYEDRCAHF